MIKRSVGLLWEATSSLEKILDMFADGYWCHTNKRKRQQRKEWRSTDSGKGMGWLSTKALLVWWNISIICVASFNCHLFGRVFSHVNQGARDIPNLPPPKKWYLSLVGSWYNHFPTALFMQPGVISHVISLDSCIIVVHHRGSDQKNGSLLYWLERYTLISENSYWLVVGQG